MKEKALAIVTIAKVATKGKVPEYAISITSDLSEVMAEDGCE